MTTLIVIAKEPVPGNVKTRLHPPLSLEQAAHLAAAAISDTLAVARSLPAGRRILLFDGVRVPPGAGDFDVVPQVAGPLDERLGAIFDDCDGPAILIGMDTPQLRADDLLPAFRQWPGDADAFFGPASDGGFWALGMAEPRGDLVRGVPMSRHDTGRIQLQRLLHAGLGVHLLPQLTDVDSYDDAVAVAALAPESAFASAFARCAPPALVSA